MISICVFRICREGSHRLTIAYGVRDEPRESTRTDDAYKLFACIADDSCQLQPLIVRNRDPQDQMVMFIILRKSAKKNP